ncbi:hypothetical protein [Nocardia barduliensis]|uniref:hypothetical protein n=1 Tax=Nocardia barduliensis TaxID=2736643 RepID=UPI001574490C|nr:hypothetical protein [Nocardia barduliensis]
MTQPNQNAPQCPACGAFLLNGAGHTDQVNWWLDPASILPADVTPMCLGLEPPAVEGFLRAFHIDSTEKVRVLSRTYGLARHHLAPFILKVVVDMVEDLIDAVAENPNVKIVFAGRDGFVLGFVLGALLPDFYARHCVAMYLPRPLVDAALRELEDREGKTFPAAEPFRKRSAVPTDPGLALRDLTMYFRLCGIEITAEGTEVRLVDSGLKGSIQEMLAAAYPLTTFSGHLMFFAASPKDPHPGSKRGYALHLDPSHSNNGSALRGVLPGDPDRTFLHHEAIIAFESMISGSKSSPTTFGRSARPHARRHRHGERPIRGVDPALVAPEYADPLVREAILALNIMAIIHYARDLAPTIIAAGPAWYESAENTRWYAELTARSNELRDQIRAWVGQSSSADPELARLLDSFVPRTRDHRSGSAFGRQPDAIRESTKLSARTCP